MSSKTDLNVEVVSTTVTPTNTFTKKVVLVGLPNSGKSQIFNNLTGQHTLVANYPLSTVEIKKAGYQVEDRIYEVFDTPGLYCLYVNSVEELAVRDFIFREQPDVIVQCLDANLIKQSLALTVDLLELGIPMVIIINAIDETSKKGIWIDSDTLSRFVGVGVIESIAIRGIGTNRLKAAIDRARVGNVSIRYGDIMESGIASIESLLPGGVRYKRKVATLILMGDSFIEGFLNELLGAEQTVRIKAATNEVIESFRGSPGRAINYKRTDWVESVAASIVKKQHVTTGSKAEAFARMCRSVVTGVPILFMIIFLMYFLVVNVANRMSDWMDKFLWFPVRVWIDSLVTQPLWRDFLTGQYGVLTLGVAGALMTVLPILSVFFILYNILEDVGYIPNLSVLSKRVFNKIGLSGAAILPMVLGFGCKTMATLTANTLRSQKEAYITIFLIAFALPCAPQIGLNMSLLGRMGFKAFLIVFLTLVLVEVATGLILNKFMKEDEKSTFIQALPAIRMPNPLVVLKKTYYRLLEFLQEALPIFIYVSMLLFALEKLGILSRAKFIFAPIVNDFLGLPSEMVDALILVMARREAAAVVIIHLTDTGKLNFVQSIVAVTLTTMFVPCFANIGVMIKQLGMKKALSMSFTITVSSIVIAGGLNLILAIFYKS
ncbi:MAG: ferrous iron transport protein B [Nitrospirae bacterium]|nr:ferrous iron transport protein B [Nitrospirota bacterium]